MKNIFKHINYVLLGGTTVIITLILSFVMWIYKPDDHIPMWLFAISMIICYIICIITYAICKNKVEITYTLPKVKKICKLQEKIIFIVEKNELYSHNSIVTIAYQDEDDELEILLGIGYVETINTQGNLQIAFQKISSDKNAQEIISKLDDKKHDINSVKIKPTIAKKLLEEELI